MYLLFDYVCVNDIAFCGHRCIRIGCALRNGQRNGNGRLDKKSYSVFNVLV